jgi:four helix bundle protein
MSEAEGTGLGEVRAQTRRKGPARRFEELEVWQRSRHLARLVYELTGKGDFGRDFGLRDQMRRAAVSVMSNIAEGFERGGDREFHQFLANAKGSAGEVRSQLYVALDAGHIDEDQFTELYVLTTDTGKLLAGLMRYLSNSEYRGSKYK